jgi:preprotein translocase subunit SecG
MEQIILVVHLLGALAIIGLILLQQGKGADMGASFGAGASQTLFGSTGSGNVLTKATAWLSVLFFATSFGLALLAKQKSAPVDDLGIEIPPVVQEQVVDPVLDSDVPVVENEAPAAMSSEEDVPEL